MATLLGPHLLDDLTGTNSNKRERDQLLAWQPPVCLVLINTVNTGPLARSGTEDESTWITRLSNMKQSELELHIEFKTAPITTPIKFIHDHSKPQDNKIELMETKVIGRIFLDDGQVKAQIMADPVKAAQFHHNLVLAARAKLNDLEAGLANRVNYWVVVNEVLGTKEAELKNSASTK